MSLEVASLYAKLGLESKGLMQGVTKAKQEMRQFAKEFGDTKVKISVDTSQVKSGTAQAKSMLNKLKTDAGNNKIKLNIDTTEFKSQLQQASNQMKNMSRNATRGAARPTTPTGGDQAGRTGANAQRQYNQAVNQTNAALDNQSRKNNKLGTEVKRITQGIILSQTFYKGVNFLQDAANGAFQMAKSAELAQMSFTAMLKDADVAAGLVNHVKDFAAETSFSFESATKGAKMLLAYGFDLKEVTEHMRTFGDAAAAMGNPQAFNGIVKALGQVRTKGKLATQEVLQLSELGIPAFEILEEKLGLTKEQLGDLGRQAIPASAAINALVTGMQERFGGAMEQMSQTVPGLMSNIGESFSIIGSEAGAGLYESFRTALSGLSETLSGWINVVRAQGIGGLFEHVIPPEFHDSIRQAMANVAGLAQSFMIAWHSTAPFRAELMQVGLLTLNLLLPVLQMTTNVLTGLSNMMFSSSTATRALVSAATGLFIFYGIQKALQAFMGLKIFGWLSNLAIRFMAAAKTGGIFAAVMQTVKAVISGGAGVPKLIALIGGLGASIAAVNAMFGKTGESLGSMMGNNKDNYLQPVSKDTNKQLDAFNNAVKTGGQNLDKTGNKVDKVKDKTEKLGKAAKKAGKDAKDGLASFDEVFTLPENKIDDVKPPSVGKPDKPSISVPDFGGIGGVGGIGGMLPDLGGVGAWGEKLQEEVTIAIDKVKFPSSMRQEFSQAWDEIKSTTRGFFETLKGITAGGLGLFFALFSGNSSLIKHKWVEMYSDMNKHTTKALGILKRTTDTGLNKVNDTWDIAMGTLPDITEEEVDSAALIFTGALQNMDTDSIQILKGTSSSMAHLFHNIRTDMTKEEAMATFTKNIDNMRKAGVLSGDQLEQELSKSMATINKNVKSYSERTKSDAENIFGALESNITKTADKMAYEVADAAKEMNKDSISEMKNMGGTMADLFDGIEADSDFTSQATRDKVTKNIEKMKANGTLNVDKMKTEFATHMKSIEENSSKQMNAVKETVRTKTFDAAKFAGSNARQIEENMDRALSEIPGMTRDHMNEAKKGMVKQLEQAGVITKAEAKEMTKGIVGEAGKTKKGLEGAMTDAKNWIEAHPEFMKKSAAALGKGLVAGVVQAIKDGFNNTIGSKTWWINTALSGLKGALRMALKTILPDAFQDEILDMIGLGRSRTAGGRSMGVSSRMATNVMGMGARNNYAAMEKPMARAFNSAIGGASEAGVFGGSGGNNYYNVTVSAPGLRGSDQASLDRMARELKVAFEREDNRTFSGSNTRQAGGIIYG